MTYIYKCQICRFRFDCINEKPVCPRCGGQFVERLIRRGKKIKREKKYAGEHIKIGKKCRDCIYSNGSEIFIATCTCNKPEVIYRQNLGWVCFSFSEKNLRLNEMRADL